MTQMHLQCRCRRLLSSRPLSVRVSNVGARMGVYLQVHFRTWCLLSFPFPLEFFLQPSRDDDAIDVAVVVKFAPSFTHFPCPYETTRDFVLIKCHEQKTS